MYTFVCYLLKFWARIQVLGLLSVSMLSVQILAKSQSCVAIMMQLLLLLMEFILYHPALALRHQVSVVNLS